MRAAIYILAPLLAVLAIVAVWRALLPACATATPLSLFGSCPAADPPPAARAAAVEVERGRSLQAQIDMLERELAARSDCTPQEIRRAAPPRQAEAEPPAIDQERWEQRDVGLLEGCWRLHSDYRVTHRDTGESVTVPYWRACFDAQGRGTQNIRMSDGTTCEGSVRAEFRENGKLRLRDAGDTPCSGGRRLLRRDGDCDLDGAGGANCELRDRYGSTSVQLRREG